MSDTPKSADQGAVRTDQPLDDIMLAMDVVDTLRHRDRILSRELDREGREQDLISRLRDIYAAQGIEVPDEILLDGVRALEEERFKYTPPEPGFGTRLAKLYVSRDKWWKPVAGALAATLVALGVWEFGVQRPQAARAEALQIELSETLPANASALFGEIESLAVEDNAVDLASTYLTDALGASADGDAPAAREAIERLQILKSDLERTFEVRVVYGPGEPLSGIYRISEDDPGGARNYYLIVEAIDPAGRPVAVNIISQEDRSASRVSRWGQGVPKSVFDRVAADKSDDQIIQDAVIGSKSRGRLTPEWDVETFQGTVLEW